MWDVVLGGTPQKGVNRVPMPGRRQEAKHERNCLLLQRTTNSMTLSLEIDKKKRPSRGLVIKEVN
jgi:hypothetical protein